MSPRLDKDVLKREITKLEKSVLAVNENLVLATGSNPSHKDVLNGVWDALKVQLNSAKMEFEMNFGKENWLLDEKGFNNN